MVEVTTAPDARLGRPFWALAGSSGLSNLADGVCKVALPLLAVRMTRSPALVAGLELVRSLPWLVGSLPVGALVDRLDRRRSMVRANAARAAFVAVPAAALAAGRGSLGLLYLAALGTGVAEVFYDTAGQSILPALVPRARLDRANGRLMAVELGAQEFAGPPVAGVLVAGGLALAFVTSSVLWALAIAALLTVHGAFRPGRPPGAGSLGADIREGLTFLFGRPVLRTMAVMVAMGNLANSAAFSVLVLYAVGPRSTLRLSEPRFGVVLAVLAAGGLAGGLAAGWVQRRLGRARALRLSVLGMTALLAGPALSSSAAAVAVLFFAGGAATMVWNITTVSFRQRVTPDHLLGRVNSAYRLLAWGTRPLGAALGGVLGQWLGVRAVFAVMGVVATAELLPARRITEQSLDAEEAAQGQVDTNR
ncbi:MAG TPA: MFS transporter [Acidimicrobiales bacterium]|nr:MFS transporter [Acidimicrobiales bacterium]